MAKQLDKAIKEALKLQLKYKIHVVSDGEQSYDMIGYFQQIPGLRPSKKGLRISGKIEPMKDPYESYKLLDFMKVKKLLVKLGADAEVKVSITGPITLGLSCTSVGYDYYQGPLDENLYMDLVEALTPIVSALLSEGAWVQLDEPGISAGFHHPAKCIHYLNEVNDGLRNSGNELNKLTVHICGDLSKIPTLKDELVSLKIKNLSLAFSGLNEKNNIKLPLKAILKAHNKRLGVGCIPVTATSIEELEVEDTVKNRVETLIKEIGKERIVFLHPDCGLKKTPLPIAEDILSRMMKGTKYLFNE
jgi:methionine synthase II (cobalamin-independent)